jgi:hypothetical protein
MLDTRTRAICRTGIRIALEVACGSLAGGCLGKIFPSAPECTGYSILSLSCVGLEVRSGSYPSRLLKGDTLRMVTYSDSGYAPATWSTGNTVLAFVTPSGLSNFVSAPSTSVLVRGVRPGVGTVTASHSSPVRTASAAVWVADSSSVAQITIWDGLQDRSIKAGDSLLLAPTLKDSLGVTVRGLPERWLTSDGAVASVVEHPPSCPICYDPRPEVFIRAKAPGTTAIVAEFLSVRGTVHVTVTP